MATKALVVLGSKTFSNSSNGTTFKPNNVWFLINFSSALNATTSKLGSLVK